MLQIPFPQHHHHHHHHHPPLDRGTPYHGYRQYPEPIEKQLNHHPHQQQQHHLPLDHLSRSMFSNGLARVDTRDGKSDLEEEDEERDESGGNTAAAADRPVVEPGRPYRRKKRFVSEPSCCPACGVTVRPQELGQHLSQELDRLYKISGTAAAAAASSSAGGSSGSRSRSGARNNHEGAPDGTPQARWETYKRIRANRQARIRTKNRKRKADDSPSCPICNERLSGTAVELNRHVEGCLNRQQNNNDGSNSSVNNDEEEVDVEGSSGGGFEEYEWAGQRRVRASSMLDGGFSAIGLATSSRAQDDEEEIDLVVDGDSSEFGAAQYSESDVITPLTEGSSREQKERDALREAVISPNAAVTSGGRPSTLNGAVEQEEARVEEEENGSSGVAEDCGREDRLVVEALRERIRELEAEMSAVGFKCLICMEQYKKPVTSVCCWHVHCEQCWLHTLGAKKLCPQCNMITSPSDLRRIYM